MTIGSWNAHDNYVVFDIMLNTHLEYSIYVVINPYAAGG